MSEYETLVDTPEGRELLGWKPLPAAPVAPAFETAWLPRTLREMAEAVAENIGVPVDLPSLVGLGVGSACTCGRVTVPFNHDWKEVAQLYIMCVMESGRGKSPVFRKMVSPLLERQTEENRGQIVAIEQAKASFDVLQARRTAAVKKKDNDEARQVAAEIAAFQMPHMINRFNTGNITPERLAELMQENGGSVALLDDEGEMLDMLEGRYQDIPDLGPYLKGYDGNYPIQMERRSGRVLVENANLSILILTQTVVAEKTMTNPRMRGKGFVSRFLIAAPEPIQEFVESKPLPAGVVSAYHNAVMRLWSMPTCTVPLSREATDLFRAWQKQVFDRTRPWGSWGGLYKDPFAEKLPGATLRLAGVLHFWQDHPEEEITAATMRNAIALARYFVGHRLHLMGGANGLTPPAADALKYLIDQKRASQKEREVKQALCKRALFRADGTAAAALEELEKAGYIQRRQEKGSGRPVCWIDLHPDLLPKEEAFSL